MGESRDTSDMPQAGFIIEHQNSDLKWKVLRNIYSGPFSDVYVITELNGDKRYAMKCERQEGNQRPVLKLDVMVLMATSAKNYVGFPRFIAAGRTHLYRYCIMSLVGPDLGRLRRTRPDRRFTLPTALQIVDQCLKRLEDMHDCGWLNRDVKAPNFAIGVGPEERTIYMLDFGFARKFKFNISLDKTEQISCNLRDDKGNVIPPRPAAALMGTFQYCAVSAHSHKDQCAKDDLESWFYMAIELLKGPLPWASIDGHKNHKLIGEQKISIRSEPNRTDFFKDVPHQFSDILDIIDQTGYYDRPNYDEIRRLVREVATEKNITMKEPLDWENNARMQLKANFVGELGESHQASSKLDAQNNKDSNNNNETMDIEFEMADETTNLSGESESSDLKNIKKSDKESEK